MIKLHIALWQFLAGGLVLGAIGAFVVRGRELKGRLRRHLMERKHPRARVSLRNCAA
jgi:hypothetical protein